MGSIKCMDRDYSESESEAGSMNAWTEKVASQRLFLGLKGQN